MRISIQVRCIGCGAKKEVGSGQRDIPLCDKCGSPMIAIKIRGKK